MSKVKEIMIGKNFGLPNFKEIQGILGFLKTTIRVNHNLQSYIFNNQFSCLNIRLYSKNRNNLISKSNSKKKQILYFKGRQISYFLIRDTVL
jgi:hypothetical protein